MKTSELRQQKSVLELQKLLSEKRNKLGQFRFDLDSGKVKNIREVRLIKKDIARILTILREQKTKEKEQKAKNN